MAKRRRRPHSKPRVKIPAGSGVALDSYSNPAARLGAGTTNLAEQGLYPLIRVSNDYNLLLSLYRGSWIVRKVIDAIPEDMLKEFPRLKSDIDPKQIEEFDQIVMDTATEAKVLETMKWARLFGGAVAIICIDGVTDLAEPLILEEIEEDSYRGLISLDRWSGVQPSAELVTSLDNPANYGLPKYYHCDTENGNMRVHHSRVLRFIGRDLPNWEKQVQQYWGMSEVELIFDELKKRDYTSWNIVSLMTRAQILAIKDAQLNNALSGSIVDNGALTMFLERMQRISETMSNQGILTLPSDGGLETHQYSFGGVAEVYNTFMLDVAGACEIPVSRLYGRSITGLGQSGEGDLQVYYDLIEQKRRRELRPQLTRLIRIMAMSAWGEVPEDLDYTFPPVRTMSDEDRSKLADIKTKSIVEVRNAEIIGRKTALKELRQMSDETGMWSNITDEMIDEADDDIQGSADFDLNDPAALGEVREAKVKKPKAA